MCLNCFFDIGGSMYLEDFVCMWPSYSQVSPSVRKQLQEDVFIEELPNVEVITFLLTYNLKKIKNVNETFFNVKHFFLYINVLIM